MILANAQSAVLDRNTIETWRSLRGDQNAPKIGVGKITTKELKMLSPDLWLQQQLRQQLWKGPAAVSTYMSMPIQLVSTAVSLLFLKDLAEPSLYILLVSCLICIVMVLLGQIASCQNHHLGLLWFSLTQSRRRMKAMGIRSEQVDRFAKRIWLDSAVAFRFRNSRLRSVELIIQALDLLSQTAAHYGSRGRKVFLANQEPIVSAIQAIECLPLEKADEVVAEGLANWLNQPPEFDPEGWALSVYRAF